MEHDDDNEIARGVQKLLDKHGSTWNSPRLGLWDRICTELHSSYEDPPDLPAFKEPASKKCKKSLTEALAGATVAFASTMPGGNQKQKVCHSGASHLESSTSVAVSPGKTVELGKLGATSGYTATL